MPFYIVRNDIAKMKTDAIVSPCDPSLKTTGGAGKAIHDKAGPKLLNDCQKLKGCPSGQAKITKGYDLDCKYVIHTAGPVWQDGSHLEKEQLEQCYLNSLQLAKEYGCKSISFPLIASGKFGFPKELALQTATQSIRKFLQTHDMDIYLVVFDKKSYQISQKLYSNIQAYIDDVYADDYFEIYPKNNERNQNVKNPKEVFTETSPTFFSDTFSIPFSSFSGPSIALPKELEDALNHIDESFSEMLLRKIDEKGMSDVQCYKKANIDRKLFSKIRSDKLYKPSKSTVIAFALALELSLEEMQELLMKAGYALSHSNKFDIIVEYFVKQKNYDVFEINEALFAFDQNLIRA